MQCIVCEQQDCTIIHSHEEIRAKEFQGCYVCLNLNCSKEHSYEELSSFEDMEIPSELLRHHLRILVAYSKLVNYLDNGDDQVSTE